MVQCEICEKEFEKNRHLRLHYARNHVDKSQWSSKCSICDKVYADEEILKRHMKNHEKRKTKVMCPVDICGKSFFRRSFLDKHILASHPESLSKETFAKMQAEINNNNKVTKKEYRCTEPGCNSSFEKHHLLTQHSYVHTNILPFQCKQCDKRFLTQNHKNRHEKIHNGYPCKNCDAVLSNWTLLLTHVARQHRKEFKCKDCDKVFFEKYRLLSHEKTHGKNRQVYQCSGCDRNFTKKHAMTKHFKIFHEGVKEFVCPIKDCHKAYAHKQTLKKHVTKAHIAPTVKEPRVYKFKAASRILGFDMKTFESAMEIS
ncbi:transcription factor IIIA-like [Styela clava]